MMKRDRFHDLLTISDAASILGMPISEVQGLIDGGKVGTVLRGDTVCLRSSDLERIARDSGPGRSHSPPSTLRWMAVGAAVAITAGSLLPNVSIGEYDKAMHWVAYLVLSGLLVLSTMRSRTMVIGIALIFLLNPVLECLQQFIPGRSVESGDLAANFLGVLSGVILGCWLRQRWGLPRRVREY